MQNIKERVAYLKGLSDGLGITHETKEGRLLIAIIDVLDDIAESIEMLEENQNELDEYVDAIDQDLADVEDEIFEDYDDDDYDEDFEDYDDFDENGFVEVECPNCHEKVYLDKDMFEDDDEDGEIVCPNCDKPIYFVEHCHCDSEECNCDKEWKTYKTYVFILALWWNALKSIIELFLLLV